MTFFQDPGSRMQESGSGLQVSDIRDPRTALHFPFLNFPFTPAAVIFHFKLFDKASNLCFNTINKFTPLRRSYPERWRDRPCESSATDRKIKVLIPADKQSNLEDKRART